MLIIDFKTKFKSALQDFLHQESSLFSCYNDSLREEAISSELKCYLKKVFSEYDVDCEYSRQPNGDKKTNDYGYIKRPDIIIHKRGHNKNNLAFIEVKWEKNPNTDIEKITSFEHLGYLYGVAIRFESDGNYQISYYDYCKKIYILNKPLREFLISL